MDKGVFSMKRKRGLPKKRGNGKGTVYFNKKTNKWIAQLSSKTNGRHAKTFDCEQEANNWIDTNIDKGDK
jgi:hypothetical protein